MFPALNKLNDSPNDQATDDDISKDKNDRAAKCNREHNYREDNTRQNQKRKHTKFLSIGFQLVLHKRSTKYREIRKFPRVLVQGLIFKALNRLRTPHLPGVL